MNNKPKRIHIPVVGEVLIEARGKGGIYQASFHYQGRHRRVSLKTSNRKAAVKLAPDVVANLLNTDGQLPPAQPTVSFEGGLSHYLQKLKSERKSPKTIGQTKLRNSAFFEYLRSKGVESFDEICPIHADGFRGSMNHDPSTVAGYYACVKAMLRYCESREIIARDPFARIPNKRPRCEKRTLPNLDQVNRILSNVDERYFEAVAACAFLGCRISELARIDRDDVDLERILVTIRPPEEYSSKTDEVRVVPIHSRLENILREYKRPRSKFYFCTQPSKRYPKGGRKLKADKVNEAFKDAATAVGLAVGKNTENGLTLHSLRGFFKTHAIFCGVPKEIVDLWQGHKSDRSVAIRHYFNPTVEESATFMEKVSFNSGENSP